MKGDNVKIYMQMMDLEYSKKVFFSLKNLNSPRCKFLRNLYLASIVRNHLQLISPMEDESKEIAGSS